MPFCGACRQGVGLPFSVQLVLTLPSALWSCAWPARQPTTAITEPAAAWVEVVALTTTSVTMLAKKQSGVVVSPWQFGVYPAGVVGRFSLKKLAPPLLDLNRPLLLATYTVLPVASAGETTTRKLRARSGKPVAVFQVAPSLPLVKTPWPLMPSPPKELSPEPTISSCSGTS